MIVFYSREGGGEGSSYSLLMLKHRRILLVIRRGLMPTIKRFWSEVFQFKCYGSCLHTVILINGTASPVHQSFTPSIYHFYFLFLVISVCITKHLAYEHDEGGHPLCCSDTRTPSLNRQSNLHRNRHRNQHRKEILLLRLTTNQTPWSTLC